MESQKIPPFRPPSLRIIGAVKRKPDGAKKSGKSKENKEIPRWGRNRKNDSVGRAGLSQVRSNQLTGNDLCQTAASESGESPLNGTPSDDVSTRQEAPADRLAGVRVSVAQAARESAQGAGIRSEIEGLLDRMSADQLAAAHANLSEILLQNQVSSVKPKSGATFDNSLPSTAR